MGISRFFMDLVSIPLREKLRTRGCCLPVFGLNIAKSKQEVSAFYDNSTRGGRGDACSVQLEHWRGLLVHYLCYASKLFKPWFCIRI
jgi:hypothetical protein